MSSALLYLLMPLIRHGLVTLITLAVMFRQVELLHSTEFHSIHTNTAELCRVVVLLPYLKLKGEYMDLFVNPDTHDLVFINGQAPVTQRMVDIVAQRLKIKLYTFLGEWFLDDRIGIPYFERVLGKSRSLPAVDAIFQSEIMRDPGVLEITSWQSGIDPHTREYSMEFTVRTIDNTESLPITFTMVGV
ncbi:baseplate protein [Pseudomonas phage EM]|uniref:Baseplate protein n=1 Tax=Pseudomonas phage EM TaxID=2936914 RepID=A0AAE9KTY1_9CAUD|nr:baseplate protein [Pseudomonas phage EM]UPW35885.1 baseplate protein [Pseudomonas phage EM]